MCFPVYKNKGKKARKYGRLIAALQYGIRIVKMESRGCFEKELEKEDYMLYNQFRTSETASNS